MQTLEKDEQTARFTMPWDRGTAPRIDQTSVYLEARREWNERYGSYIAREHSWKVMCLLMAFITLIAVGSMAYSSSQSKFVPYVVEVDKLGSAVAVSRADVASKADSRVIRAQLAHWIENVRSVYQDAGAERVNIESAYSMLRKTDPAYTKLTEYMKNHDPFELAKSQGIGVQISSVLPISDTTTWQINWKESTHTSKGELVKTAEHQANVTIAIDLPTQESILLRNPMGIYIVDYHWSERL